MNLSRYLQGRRHLTLYRIPPPTPHDTTKLHSRNFSRLRRNPPHLAALILLLFALRNADLRSAAAGQGGTLVLEGIYSYNNAGLPRLPSVETSTSGDFQVALQGSAWAITYTSLSAETNRSAMFSQVDASCDGRDTFVVHSRNPLTTPREVAMTEATIYPGVYPPPMERDAYNLWIAFLSRSVWSNANGYAKPPNIPDLSLFYNSNATCQYFWSTSPEHNWVRRLLLKSEGRILTRNIHHNAQLQYLSLPPPYGNGYNMAEGRWLAETNINGSLIPLRFEFTYFTPKGHASSDTDLDTYYSFRCTVTNVYPAEPRPIPVGLQDHRLVVVTDHRFADEGVATVTYGITDKWSAVVDERAAGLARVSPRQSLEEQSLQQQGFEPASESRLFRKILARVLLGTVLICPLIVFMIRGAVRKQKHR